MPTTRTLTLTYTISDELEQRCWAVAMQEDHFTEEERKAYSEASHTVSVMAIAAKRLNAVVATNATIGMPPPTQLVSEENGVTLKLEWSGG